METFSKEMYRQMFFHYVHWCFRFIPEFPYAIMMTWCVAFFGREWLRRFAFLLQWFSVCDLPVWFNGCLAKVCISIIAQRRDLILIHLTSPFVLGCLSPLSRMKSLDKSASVAPWLSSSSSSISTTAEVLLVSSRSHHSIVGNSSTFSRPWLKPVACSSSWHCNRCRTTLRKISNDDMKCFFERWVLSSLVWQRSTWEIRCSSSSLASASLAGNGLKFMVCFKATRKLCSCMQQCLLVNFLLWHSKRVFWKIYVPVFFMMRERESSCRVSAKTNQRFGVCGHVVVMWDAQKAELRFNDIHQRM